MIAHKLLAMAKKDVLTAARSRSSFAFHAVAQAAQIATFYYLACAVGPKFRPEGMPYFLFLLVGTGFYAFLLTGIQNLLRSIQEAQQTGILEVLMTTSTSEPLLLALEASSAFGEGLLQLALYFALAVGLFASTLHINAAAGLAIFAFSTLTAFALGLFAAGLQIYMQKGSAVLWLIGSGAWLMSGTLFPVTALPRAARVVSFCIPFTHSLFGMRLALLGGDGTLMAREVVTLGAFAFVLVPAGVVFFSWTVSQARRNGTLSFY